MPVIMPPPRSYAPRGLAQSYSLRDLAANLSYAIAQADDPKEIESLLAKAQAVSGLARAWDTACNRSRIIRGRPLPGSLRPERVSKRKGNRSQSLVVEDKVQSPVSPDVTQDVTQDAQPKPNVE